MSRQTRNIEPRYILDIFLVFVLRPPAVRLEQRLTISSIIRSRLGSSMNRIFALGFHIAEAVVTRFKKGKGMYTSANLGRQPGTVTTHLM